MLLSIYLLQIAWRKCGEPRRPNLRADELIIRANCYTIELRVIMQTAFRPYIHGTTSLNEAIMREQKFCTARFLREGERERETESTERHNTGS